MQLRFRWVLAPGAGESLSRARSKLFRQVVDAWSPEDREAVAGFLQDRIRAARADDEGASWADQLTAALDYRAWHAFEVERRVGAEWRAATGPASGGERVLAATIPLFAAAASHYSGAGPHAPRLVLLDEAFAGVDDDMRRKCLGLLAEFDLDVVMTSEREWACYPEVPGIAIAQLARHGDLDAVHVSRWWWDGRRLHEVEAPEPRLGPDPPGEVGDDTGSLFAET